MGDSSLGEIGEAYASQRSVSLKKQRGRSILSSFFCCFRDYNVEAPPPSSPSVLPPLVEENGGLQKGDQRQVIPVPSSPAKYLLPEVTVLDYGKKCVVIDLDETLVHSSFKPISNADFIVPVEIDGTIHQVYVLKRPHVDEFLQRMGQLFECVLFTASLAKYADPVADLLDRWGVFRARLFRESCVFHRGNYVKDLSRLGRELSKVIIVDNSPASYIFHPENAVPVQSWFDDMADTELLDLIPFFEGLSREDDVYSMLHRLCSRNLDRYRKPLMGAGNLSMARAMAVLEESPGGGSGAMAQQLRCSLGARGEDPAAHSWATAGSGGGVEGTRIRVSSSNLSYRQDQSQVQWPQDDLNQTLKSQVLVCLPCLQAPKPQVTGWGMGTSTSK
ncbi:hypothetical protein STEG23_007268, partial [Scotinomys teguina]